MWWITRRASGPRARSRHAARVIAHSARPFGRISGGKSPSAAASTTGQRRLTRARMRRATPARAIDPARRRRPSQRAAGAMALVKTGGAVQQVAEEGGEADDDRADPVYPRARAAYT